MWAIVIFLCSSLNIFLSYLFGIVAFFRLLSLGSPNAKVQTIASGIEGEEFAIITLKKLTDDYTVICDINVEVDGSKSQLDFVVVGPTGIFITEVKHWKGSIHGNEEDKEWRQDKVGRKGGEYSNHYYNPTKQVSTHVYRLAKFLKNNGIHQWVKGIVFFSHPGVELNIKTDKIPIFAESENDGADLLTYIQSSTNKERLTEAKIDQIVSTLLSETNIKGTA